MPRHLTPAPATPYFEQLSIGAGRRTLALSLAILITGFLLLMLLFFDPGKPPEKREERVIVVSLDPAVAAEEIGRAHVLTPVTNAHLVCRLLLEKKNTKI